MPDELLSLPAQIGPYRNRILGLRVMPAGELLDNPRNWRKHPPAQESGLDAVTGINSLNWLLCLTCW